MTTTNDISTQDVSYYPTMTNDDEYDSNIEEFKEEEEEDAEGEGLGIDVESSPGSMTAASSSRKSIQSSKSSTDGSERATSRLKKTAGLPVPPPPPPPPNKSSLSLTSATNKKASPPSQQSKKKKNKEFEDFEATGKWGQVSNKEMYVVGCVAVAIVIAIVVVVVVFVTGNKQAAQDSYNTPPEPTVFPTLSQQEQLDLIRATVTVNAVTASYASAIPTTVDALNPNAWVDASGDTDPLVRAVSWKILQDTTMDASNRILERFALAAIYFETVGEEWKNSDAFWLNTESNVCDGTWFGVKCMNDVVTEIQLTGNNLKGNIPIALALLPTLQSLWLDSNALQGMVNGDIFSETNMPNMQFLYLQSNQLTGPIPTTFLSNGSDIRTIYLQGNNFTGGFPEEYCPTCETCPHPMMKFGLDCKKNPCPNEWCCDPYDHCFD